MQITWYNIQKGAFQRKSKPAKKARMINRLWRSVIILIILALALFMIHLSLLNMKGDVRLSELLGRNLTLLGIDFCENLEILIHPLFTLCIWIVCLWVCILDSISFGPSLAGILRSSRNGEPVRPYRYQGLAGIIIKDAMGTRRKCFLTCWCSWRYVTPPQGLRSLL